MNSTFNNFKILNTVTIFKVTIKNCQTVFQETLK